MLFSETCSTAALDNASDTFDTAFQKKIDVLHAVGSSHGSGNHGNHGTRSTRDGHRIGGLRSGAAGPEDSVYRKDPPIGSLLYCKLGTPNGSAEDTGPRGLAASYNGSFGARVGGRRILLLLLLLQQWVWSFWEMCLFSFGQIMVALSNA